MLEIDNFAVQLLEESKRYLELADERPEAESHFLHAALMLAFCALEAHVNAIADELSLRKELTTHERAILLEREVRIKNGVFELQNGLKIHRLEDRIEFIHARFGQKTWVTESWRRQLAGAMDLRNKLTHPKSVPHITKAAVKNAIVASIDVIDSLYRAAYRKKFPTAKRGLTSSLGF